MIIGEEPSDGGEIILAKGRSIGYLAQHQNLIPNGTIYEELRSAKADIIEMEQQLRSIEHELQSLSGEELMPVSNIQPPSVAIESQTDMRVK